jgi:hypothetical protein
VTPIVLRSIARLTSYDIEMNTNNTNLTLTFVKQIKEKKNRTSFHADIVENLKDMCNVNIITRIPLSPYGKFRWSEGIVPAPLVEPIILVKRVGLVLSEYHHHLIELYFPLSLLICHVVLNNNNSLILTFLR